MPSAKQLRPLRISSWCSGICSEMHACSALGVEATLTLACDTKPSIQRLLLSGQLGFTPTHLFDNLWGLVGTNSRPPESKPKCLKHCKQCPVPTIDYDRGGEERDDILVAGFPCQPFSTQTAQRRTPGAVTKHKLYPVGKGVQQGIFEHRPRSFILENVMGFMQPFKSVDDGQGGQSSRQSSQQSSWQSSQQSSQQSTSGARTPLEEMLQWLEELGTYHVKAITIALDAFITVSRNRHQQLFKVCSVGSVLIVLRSSLIAPPGSTPICPFPFPQAPDPMFTVNSLEFGAHAGFIDSRF